MKKVIILLAALAIAAPALAAPGVDMSANHICPGVAGALSDGGPLDCAAVIAANKNVSLYCTFIPAENISDLSAFDAQVDMSLVGTVATDGAFWNGETGTGACLEANGGSIRCLGGKPQNGDPCGTSLTIREIFIDAAGVSMFSAGPSTSNMFLTTARGGGVAVTNANRVFGFELRWDPAYSADPEVGGPCGTCHIPVCFQVIKGSPKSLTSQPTTDLTTGTGTAGVGPQAWYNNGCPGVPTKARTWGQLKSLYR